MLTPMTYQQLKDAVNELTEEQLKGEVHILLLGKLKVVRAYETVLYSEIPTKVQGKIECQVMDDVPLITVDEI